MSDRSTAEPIGRTSTDAPSKQTSVDPSGFTRDYKPAVIRFQENDPITCAHHQLKDSWLWILNWDKQRVKIPTCRIQQVESIKTLRAGNDGQKRLSKDPEEYL